MDTLRFFAFFAVFVHHALPQDASVFIKKGVGQTLANWVASSVRAGGFGVDLFFVLSSYLITELLVREIRVRRRLDVRAFYVRRALRIWPLYYGFLLLVIFVLPHLIPGELLPRKHAIAYLGLVGNWAVVAWGYPSSAASPLWSVSIEEQFYVVWPLLLAAVGPARISIVAWCMIALAVIVRIGLALTGATHPAIWCDTFARLDPIAGGALLACVLRGGLPQLRGTLRIVLTAGSTLVLVAASRFFSLDGWTASVCYPLVALASVCLVVAMLGTTAAWCRSRAFVFLGRISYGLYVYHLLAIALVERVLDKHVAMPFSLRVLVSFAITIALAAVSYRVLERPFLRIKARFAVIASRPEGEGVA